MKKITILTAAIALLFSLSACQLTGKARDVIPGIDVEVKTNDSDSTSTKSSDNPAWQDGEHCPPGQKKKKNKQKNKHDYCEEDDDD